MGIFSSGEKRKLGLVFDIGSSSVGGALFYIEKSKVPQIIHSVREPLVLLPKLDVDQFLSLTFKTLSTVAEKISKAGVGAPDKIFCVLGPAWYGSQTRIIKLVKNTPFTFTTKLADELIQKEIHLFKKDVESLFPEVDHFIGTGEYYKISSIVESGSRGNYSIPSYIHSYEAPRLNSMPSYTAYLKLTEGCDRRCAFCIIPKIRGKQKSQSIENLVLEAKALVQNGVTELNLIGQDLTSYGTDLRDQRTNLEALLKELVKVKEVKWIRLLYCYPDHITEEFLSLLRNEEKICNYIDMP